MACKKACPVYGSNGSAAAVSVTRGDGSFTPNTGRPEERRGRQSRARIPPPALQKSTAAFAFQTDGVISFGDVSRPNASSDGVLDVA
jgi:hypothetical protein